jgi:hypothetical protein
MSAVATGARMVRPGAIRHRSRTAGLTGMTGGAADSAHALLSLARGTTVKLALGCGQILMLQTQPFTDPNSCVPIIEGGVPGRPFHQPVVQQHCRW